MPKINLQKFNLFSGLNNQELIALELSTGTLKLVHANSSPNKFEILDLSSRNIADNEEAEIAKGIRAALGEIKFKNPRIVAVVPAHLVITKNIEIPSTNPHEIKEIINLQAGRHTPYSREEIIIDYIEIGTYRRSYTKILLVIVARSAVRRQFQILDKIGIQPEKVLFAPEGVAWAAGRMFNLDTSVFPGCVLNIEESFTDFAIVFKGKIIFIRSVPIGAGHLTTEKDKYRDKFAEEIKRSLEAYQNEDIERSPQGVTLSSSAQDLNYLEPLLSETLRLPVKFFPYLKNVPMSSAASRSASGIINNVSFLNAIASAYAWREMRVDLIPDEIRFKRAIEQRGKDLTKTGIFVLLSFLLMFGILLSKIHFKNTYLNKLTKQYDTLDKDTQKLENDFSKINLIKSYLARRGLPLEILTELYNITPLEIELNDIRLDEQGRFSIKGTAGSTSAVFAFVEDMGKSKYFKDVKTKYTTKRKEGLKDVTDFEITCQIQKDAAP